MMTPMSLPDSTNRRSAMFDWIGLACRLILGGVLLVAGAIKIPALEQSVLAVRGYDVLPYGITMAVGYTMPFLEVLVGLLLITGLLTRWAGLAGAGFMLVFIFAISQAWARGISIDCGCFGGGGEVAWDEARAAYPWEIARDIALFLTGAWLVWRPRSRFSADEALFGAPEFSVESDEPDSTPDELGSRA